MLPKEVDKKSKTLFYGKLEGVVHGTNMIMGPHFPLLVSLNSLLYRNVVASGRARPRGLAPGQRSSKETSQRLRAVGYTVSGLTGLGIESQTFRIDSEIF